MHGGINAMERSLVSKQKTLCRIARIEKELSCTVQKVKLKKTTNGD